MLLQRSTLIKDVYDECKQKWNENVAPAMGAQAISLKPDDCLGPKQFVFPYVTYCSKRIVLL